MNSLAHKRECISKLRQAWAQMRAHPTGCVDDTSAYTDFQRARCGLHLVPRSPTTMALLGTQPADFDPIYHAHTLNYLYLGMRPLFTAAAGSPATDELDKAMKLGEITCWELGMETDRLVNYVAARLFDEQSRNFNF